MYQACVLGSDFSMVLGRLVFCINLAESQHPGIWASVSVYGSLEVAFR